MKRYHETAGFYTPRDPLADLLVHLEYLASRDYSVELLVTRHGVAPTDAKSRAKKIAPHVRMAGAYVEQALLSQTEVSFLPAYYAILNLIKVYILFGPHHAELPKNRYHGAAYPGFEKDSRSLETEVIELHTKGAIPLCYRTITGRAVAKKTRLKLGDLYPYVADVSVEWKMATGRAAKLARMDVAILKGDDGRRVSVKATPFADNVKVALRQLHLRKMRKVTGLENHFLSDIESDPGVSDEKLLARHVNRQLLYLTPDSTSPISGGQLLLPEELPIALVFFHLSSISRYKPEFLSELRDSKYWPVVAAARWHGLYKFLLLFSSFVQQKTVRVNEV